ncbi:unnamed protein product [Brassica rapa]|uniref:Uncharacterized protein n=1 Tax=Brassica campestris TaxID=3711 RepID=A0A8D9GQQ9_BRACM|nr:unnamed protein product [Brassica rapa]
MASLKSPFYMIILFAYGVAISSSFLVRAHEQKRRDENRCGSNVTFECSPSGPCVSCNSSERRKEKYRCSETGYRIPFKCREVRGEEASHKKDAKETQQRDQSNVNDEGDEDVVDAFVKQRNLHDDSSPKA